MDLNLKGKIVLITGSSKGIGRKISENLSSEGCKVLLNSRNEKELIETSKTIPNSDFFVGNVCSKKDSQLIIEKIIKILFYYFCQKH